MGSSRGASVVVRAGTEWEAKYKRLVGSSVRSLTPDEAENLVKSGDFIFVDVRPEADYETARIPGERPKESFPTCQPRGVPRAACS